MIPLLLRKLQSAGRRLQAHGSCLAARLLVRCGYVPTPLTIISGADSSHAESLFQLIGSLVRHESTCRIIVYDLGMGEPQLERIRVAYPTVELRVFEYLKYPEYFNIKQNAGEYAWKPTIVSDVVEEVKGSILWLDAGCVITQPLLGIRRVLTRNGLYSPRAGGTVGDWTHPATFAGLGADSQWRDWRQFSGGIVGVNSEHSEARGLIRRWRDCAFDKACIAPPGSNRSNHRQDQAVLSILIYQSSLWKHIPTQLLGVLTHQDIDDRSR